ncbi:MAG: ABC transporter substrate-binding protein [Phycisphaerales bacterium]
MSRSPGHPRVVSLLPSATELLCAIGAEDLLVGRSHECDWPPNVAGRPALTSQTTHGADSASIDAEVKNSVASGRPLYAIDVDLLNALEPDVILTQDLCEVCSLDLETVRRVADRLPKKPTVVSLDPKDIFGVLDDLLVIGDAVGRTRDAEAAMVALRSRYWSAVDYVNPYVPGPEVLFLEWIEPPFVGGHWTPLLIEAAGGQHSLNRGREKSRQVAPEEILAAAPRRVVICPCGFDLPRVRRELPALRRQRWWPLVESTISDQSDAIVLVDGNQMFSRPGPRLVDAFEWLVSWLNDRPQLRPSGFPVEPLPR